MKYYHGFTSDFGYWTPQLLVQITPLCWGIGFGFGGGQVALKIGPVAVALHWRIGTMKREAEWVR